MGDHPTDGVNRRKLLECMGWAGTGALWTLTGGVASSISLDQALAAPCGAARAFSFVQISDTHIGFDKPANPDARATAREAVAKIIALPQKPDFILHTGDITHLSKDVEFDDADQILKVAGVPVFHVPGEHDTLDEKPGAAYLARYGTKETRGSGWYSFDHDGVHFIALVNVLNLKAGGLGALGMDQLEWMERDLKHRPASTPVVVFAHMPLWTVSPEWGWGTDDSSAAMSYLKRFGSVTVLNGHIHQVIQKTEGNISFHTARSTAFPQAAPGTPGASPGPLKVPTEQLHSVLGIRSANVVRGQGDIALIDQTLAGSA
jgi:Icc protein